MTRKLAPARHIVRALILLFALTELAIAIQTGRPTMIAFFALFAGLAVMTDVDGVD